MELGGPLRPEALGRLPTLPKVKAGSVAILKNNLENTRNGIRKGKIKVVKLGIELPNLRRLEYYALPLYHRYLLETLVLRSLKILTHSLTLTVA